MELINSLYNSEENMYETKTNNNNDKLKNSAIISGKITRLLYPRSIEQFNGWAKFVMNNSIVVCGSIPTIDKYYIYSIRCTILSKSEKQKMLDKHASIGPKIKYTMFDKPVEIINIISIKREPFSLILLANMMRKELNYSESMIQCKTQQLYNLASIYRSNIPLNVKLNTTQKSKIIMDGIFGKCEWFSGICTRTNYFHGVYIDQLISAYGNKKRYKIMKLTNTEIQQLVSISKENPEYLCLNSKNPVSSKIGELSPEGLVLIKRYNNNLHIRDTFATASIKLYQIMKNLTKIEGHTIYPISISKNFKPELVNYLKYQQIVTQDSNNILCLKESIKRNMIIEKFIEMLLCFTNNISKSLISKNITIREDDSDDDDNNSETCVLICKNNKKRKLTHNTLKLDEYQQKAYESSFILPLLIINGKPGRGKTQLLEKIVKDHPKKTYLLLSPTGMAATRIHELTGHKAMTIDLAILDIKNKKIDLNVYSGIIIDEFSMVNEKTLSKLFMIIDSFAIRSIKQLILVGDHNQLPPIGYGYPLIDFTNKYPENVFELKQNHRVDPNFRLISTLCDNILDKNTTLTLSRGISKLNSKDHNDSCIIIKRKHNNIEIDVLKVLESIPENKRTNLQILTHKNSTCDKINEKFIKTKYNLQRVIEKNIVFRRGQKIIFTKNIYNNVNLEKKYGIISSSVSNGEIGIIKKIIYYHCDSALGKRKRMNTITEVEVNDSKGQPPNHNKIWRLALVLEKDEKKVDVNFIGIHNIKNAICITGSKSQGSQYDTVIIAIDSEMDNINNKYIISKHFSKTLLYTMISRAKKKVIIICNFDEFEETGNGELDDIISNNNNNDEIRFRNLINYLP